jgi:integrase
MLVVLAMYSGLRVVEIADLKVCDFYFSRNYPYLIVRNGKGGKKRMHWRRRE